ncbi:hypothetical protein K491DRAFT_712452 [Lophiostoma macrostomum CBS 122681]|uniref:Uncharacterized protein n=1 Tax=Lophiostoma macrostomum CBS 122681 TaxID=1314788 RepID=A0A6A6TK49_9PLEO|nr:hypothetical protein K491DRAFT_712452 [Lophiostoma macrostomum CBS 122681]
MHLLTYTALLTTTLTAAAHVGGQCTFHVNVQQKCTRSHFGARPGAFIDLPTLFDGAHNALALPSHTGGRVSAKDGNRLSKMQENEWGGKFRWLPWADLQEEMEFEYNGHQWSQSDGKDGYGCGVGEWTQGKLVCGKDEKKWPQPRYCDMDCFFPC